MNKSKKCSFKKAYENNNPDVWMKYVKKHELTVDDAMDMIREVYGQVFIDDLISEATKKAH